ncbi:MAG TPA: hypothetical protein VHR66_22655 [Gemmataceae bacterium]|jgi:hypothetical protein|nr:hypothetical protein [Gemmataceae bacterium]
MKNDMDEWNAFGPGMKVDRHTAEWGMASALAGGVLVIAAPVQLLFNLHYWRDGLAWQNPGELPIYQVGSSIVLLSIFVLIGFGVFAGFRGLGSSRARQQPAALPLVGLFICATAAIMWIGLTVMLAAIWGAFGP